MLHAVLAARERPPATLTRVAAFLFRRLNVNIIVSLTVGESERPHISPIIT